MAVVQKLCTVCQQPMLTYNARKVYCSDRCRKKVKPQVRHNSQHKEK